jgi:hypothetical protein
MSSLAEYSLSDLLAPVTPQQFRADVEGRAPLHIPAEGGSGDARRALLDWDTFNGLLAQSSIWTHSTLQLVHSGKQLPAENYCAEVQTMSGPVVRPSPAKVQVMMAMGATVIANDVGALTPSLRAVCDTLRTTWAASVAANVYCSFKGVQGFGPHYDTHDVFAVQTGGEKVWRLYRNRETDPVDYPGEGEEVRRYLASACGPVMQEVRMRPGDVLYIPRGWYHDALAVDGPSLHVTLSVTPLYGRILFRLLESAAMQDPAFRAWLPPATQGDGKPLAAHLADLGQRLATLSASPAFAREIAMTQQRLIGRSSEYRLPERIALTRFSPTGLMLPANSGPAAVAMEWAMAQPRFVLEDMIAQFDFVPEVDLRAAVEAAVKAGALKPVDAP